MSEFPRKLSIVLLFALLGLCVYRARTQSFTIDEAWVFQLYVNKPLVEFARLYDPSNHVLHTLAMKLCRWWFGTGELALRVPTLIGAALYFRVAYLMSVLLFRRWMQFLALAVLVLHPLVLDFFVAARGYGLGLALFTWSLYFVLCYFTKGLEGSRLSLAGIFAGLAIAANLTLLVPAAALGLVLIVLLWREERTRSLWAALDRYGGAAVVIASVFLVLPLLVSTPDSFYFGGDSLLHTSYSLVEAAVKDATRPSSLPLLAAINPVAYVVVPVVFFILGIGACVVAVRYVRAARADFRLAPFALTAGTLALSVVLLVLAHHAAGVLYPLHRTGLYLIPLFTLAVLLGIQFLRFHRTAIVLTAVLVAAYVSQIENRYFTIWRFDASMAKLMRKLSDDYISRRPKGPARVATSGELSRTAAYYQVRRRMDWLSISETPLVADADYYLLTGKDRDLATSMNLHVVEDDRLSGTLLARRAP